MRLKALFAASAALAASACSGAQTGKAPDTVDKMAKADVQAIVREYLLANPEILFEMQAAYERKVNDEQTDKAEGAWTRLLETAKDDPSIGPKDAPITIIEFSDYDCGFCKAALPWVLAQVDDRRGDVRLIVKESAWRGEGSQRAALAALAADKQGKYRDMHVALMKSPSSAYTPDLLEKTARSIGLDIPRWKQDMASAASNSHMDRSVKEFEEAGMRGTPAFLINGKFIGGFDQQGLDSLIEATRQMTKGRR